MCAGSSEPSLFAEVIQNKISCVGQYSDNDANRDTYLGHPGTGSRNVRQR